MERLVEGIRVADERLLVSIQLLATVKRLCVYLLVVMVVVGMGLAFIFDYMTGTREQIKETKQATREVRDEAQMFSRQNEIYLANHSRTQRLICYSLRVNQQPLPTNGDCDER